MERFFDGVAEGIGWATAAILLAVVASAAPLLAG